MKPPSTQTGSAEPQTQEVSCAFKSAFWPLAEPEPRQSLSLVLELVGWHVNDLLTTDLEKLSRSMAKYGKATQGSGRAAFDIYANVRTGRCMDISYTRCEPACMCNEWMGESRHGWRDRPAGDSTFRLGPWESNKSALVLAQGMHCGLLEYVR